MVVVELLDHQRDNRPGGNRTAIECSGGRTVLSVVDLTGRDWDLWLDAYRVGYVHGYEAGIETERDEVAALQSAAVAAVTAAAEIPARDRVLDDARAAARASWWVERRGEAI